MRGRGSQSTVSVILFFILCICCSAWPWPGPAENGDSFLLKRRMTQTIDSAQSTSASALSVPDFNGPTANVSAHSIHANATSHHSTKTTSIDPRLPPGGIEMITPAAIAGSQYFKVGDFVTFAWNYTSLSVTPTAIDVFASCATNNQLYTITTNMTVDPTGEVVWDTGEYQATATVPLLVATYTLIIYDASKDITSVPSAGYLDTYNQYAFGMYTPQPYVPFNEFRCATCSGAFSNYERQAIGSVLITSAITILSFTWFTTGLGLL